MNAIVRYLAGGALALSSQGFFAVSFGLPGAVNSGAEPLSMVRLQDVQSSAGKTAISFQQVDRSRKGDRLPGPNTATGPTTVGEFVANNQGIRKPVKPVAKPVKQDVEQKLPEGCSASISPLSDRIAANQASNCITALELPYKVAMAD